MHDGMVVASCMDSRNAYDRCAAYVDTAEFTPMAAFWWQLVDAWYRNDDTAASVDRAVIRQRGERTANAKHVETMLGWFDALPDIGSPDNVVSELLAVKRHAKANELGALASENPDKVLPVAREYVQLLEAEDIRKDTWIEAGSWEELDEELTVANKIKILPLALNERLDGGALPGHHIGIFGATEIGKSLLAINMVCGFLRQQQRVLVVSNEDAARVWKNRVRCNLAGMSATEVRNNPDKATSIATAKGAGLLVVGNMAPGDCRQIEDRATDCGADIVVVDQLRNLHAVHGSRNANNTAKHDQVSQEFRSLLIQEQLLGVSIMQAHAGEHGKPTVWYSADDVDSSRVGYSAQCDLLLGVGATENMLDQNQRAISLCKNKLGGGEKKNREGFIVTFDTARSKCK